ncbi:FxSxx-COOH cyclophane-containing RiPP peptide [Streptomyces sp. NPDC102360]|uniref:FxSxx-COOH cyclophane-containing RiPP peptide n=1 Tax=Streptomyces sp. NPDC102360 TaxID=3366160 RepID=UPI0038162A12
MVEAAAGQLQHGHAYGPGHGRATGGAGVTGRRRGREGDGVNGDEESQDAAGLPGPREPLPDLTRLALKDLADIQHPVLQEVLAELRGRAEQPGETLWGFNNSFT